MDTIEQKTLAYWNVCSAYHGRISQYPKLTTEQALRILQDDASVLGPHRPLKHKVLHLLGSIIEGTPKGRGKKQPTITAKVLPLVVAR